MYRLYDNWTEKGVNPEELRKLLEEIDSATEYIPVLSEAISLYSFEGLEDGKVYMKLVCPEDERSYEASFIPGEAGEDVSEDYLRDKSPVISAGDSSEKLFCRNSVVRDIFGLSKITGAELTRFSRERDAYLMRILTGRKKLMLAVRGNGVSRKVFSVMSGSYCPGSMTDIMQIFDSIGSKETGQPEMVSWKVNQDTAEAEFVFGEIRDRIRDYVGLPEEFLPGIRIVNSGTGESCFRASLFWKVNESVFTVKSLKRIHRGTISPEEYISELNRLLIESARKLSGRLRNLMDAVIVSEEDGTASVSRKLGSAVEKIIRYIGLRDVFRDSEKTADSYTERIESLILSVLSEITEKFEGPLTAYDVASCIIQIPTRAAGIPEQYAEKFADACGKAPFADFIP